MEVKVFEETNSWGDTSGTSADVNFSSEKKIKGKKSKKNKKRKHSEIDDDGNAECGKWVR